MNEEAIMRKIRAQILEGLATREPDPNVSEEYTALTISSLIMAFETQFPWAPLRPTTKELK